MRSECILRLHAQCGASASCACMLNAERVHPALACSMRSECILRLHAQCGASASCACMLNAERVHPALACSMRSECILRLRSQPQFDPIPSPCNLLIDNMGHWEEKTPRQAPMSTSGVPGKVLREPYQGR